MRSRFFVYHLSIQIFKDQNLVIPHVCPDVITRIKIETICFAGVVVVDRRARDDGVDGRHVVVGPLVHVGNDPVACGLQLIKIHNKVVKGTHFLLKENLTILYLKNMMHKQARE
jgi:hypothetical protein